MLDNTHADALATAIMSAVGVSDAPSIAKAKTAIELIYSHLKADILITIGVGAIATTGGPAAQAGPTPSPVSINPA